jgi:tetratricopeptide (TPR) repeat protein
MKADYNTENFREIIDDLNNRNFNKAVQKIIILSKNYPNFNMMNWENAVKSYEKTLTFKINKFKIYTNIGVILFKLGKINQSINAFKSSIKDNPNFNLAHDNLGISYLELGMLQDAIHHFVLALKLNKNDLSARKNLINILSLSRPINNHEHSLINLNYKISRIVSNLKIKNYYETNNIKKILDKSDELINNTAEDLFLNETQIFRKNSKNLNCFRHFKVFNEFNVIPKYCFSCYKVQINLFTIVDLIKLYLIFDNLHLKNNNLKKCMVETRDQIKGNYKGYVYCEGLSEAKDVMKKINQEILKIKLDNFKIVIKHGCSEFYKSYPKFEDINFNGEQEMRYKKDWQEKEDIIDKRDLVRLKTDKKIRGESLKGINLSDILIIKNWINYANVIGDYSYKKIYEREIKPSFINKVLQSQLIFRKKDL